MSTFLLPIVILTLSITASAVFGWLFLWNYRSSHDGISPSDRQITRLLIYLLIVAMFIMAVFIFLVIGKVGT